MAPDRRLEKANDFPFGVDVDLLEGRFARQAGHGHHLTAEWIKEASTHGSTDVAHGQGEAGWCAFLVGVVREREMCLGHADGQLIEAKLSVEFDFLFGVWLIFD